MTEIQKEALKLYQDALDKEIENKKEQKKKEREEILVGARQQFWIFLPSARLIENGDNDKVQFLFDGQIFDCGKGDSLYGGGLKFYLSPSAGPFKGHRFANMWGYGYLLFKTAQGILSQPFNSESV
jgi:hypothetical protein